MTDPRKLHNKRRNRSRSGATTVCPECGKKLRGEKGLAMHRLEAHGIEPKKKGAAF